MRLPTTTTVFARPSGSGAILVACLGLGTTVAGALAAAGVITPYSEEAIARGIAYTPDQTVAFGDGLAFADLDDDGDADAITLGRANGIVGLYENDGTGQFTDRFGMSGIPPLTASSGVIAGDYDRDGDLDLYISRRSMANVLLRNEGGFHFTNVTGGGPGQSNVGDTGDGSGCAWADFDNDGWLDLYAANRGQPNRLYRNLGPDGFGGIKFQDVAVTVGVDRGNDPTFQGAFFDFDEDGDADLYLATDHGTNCNQFRNHLFENLGGFFIDITDEGTEACLDAMCVAIGDFDGDGLQDLYSTNTRPGNALMMNQGGGVFTREEIAAGVASYAVGWGSVFHDFDNDGHMDLYVCNMSDDNRLYRNDGSWPCEDVSAVCGVDVGLLCFSVAAADIDLDGDLDLMTMSRNQPIRLFINREGEKRQWARFDVVGEGPNRYAIGARVSVRTGATRRVREVTAGENYKAQNELVLHVGLGDAALIDEINVSWPGGTTRTLTSLSSSETWTLVPPDKLGDGDRDGDRDVDDFLRFVACYTGDAPGSLQPGCETMDMEGDGDVDLDDFDLFLADYEGPQEDCDDNGTIDAVQILLGEAEDVNANGIIDGCEIVLGDVNGDGVVGFGDLLEVLSNWGPCFECPQDLDGDGVVGFQDLLTVLSNWS